MRPLHDHEELVDGSYRTSESETSIDSDSDEVERFSEFGSYQWLLLVLIWWGNISTLGNVVFMVFGGADGVCEDQTPHNTTCQNMTYPFKSVVAEWGLDKGSLTYIPAMMTSIQLAGALFGALTGGQLADSFGRKMNSWLFFGLQVAVVPLSAFSPNWQTMCAFRFLIGFTSGAYDSCAIIFVMEWVNDNSRLPVQTSLDCMYSLGFVWFSFLAYVCPDWRVLSIVIGLQGLPALFGFYWMEEPLRWLVLKKKFRSAATVAKKIRKWNCLSCDIPKFALAQRADLKVDPAKKTRTTTYLDMFRGRKLAQHSVMLMFSFFVTGSVGYMLIFNSGNLLGNIFLNFGLMGIVNCIGAILTALLNQFLSLGRKPLHQIALNGVLICLVTIATIYILHKEHEVPALLTAAAIVGSSCSFPLWVICNLYSGELFPTRIRNMGSALGSMAARIGGIVAPQILFLFKAWHPLPFIVTGTVTLVNIVLALFFLPETRGKLNEDAAKQVEQPSYRALGPKNKARY